MIPACKKSFSLWHVSRQSERFLHWKAKVFSKIVIQRQWHFSLLCIHLCRHHAKFPLSSCSCFQLALRFLSWNKFSINQPQSLAKIHAKNVKKRSGFFLERKYHHEKQCWDWYSIWNHQALTVLSKNMANNRNRMLAWSSCVSPCRCKENYWHLCNVEVFTGVMFTLESIIVLDDIVLHVCLIKRNNNSVQ